MPFVPEIIGHRGAPRTFPENTLAAFLRALELGADGIELDVHLTRDGVVVVHHDAVPRAISPMPELAGRPFTALTLDEVRTFRLGRGAPIPTLQEVLDAVDGRAFVYVEVKGRAMEGAVAASLASRTAWTAVHSFDHRVVQRVRRDAPTLRGGVLLDSYLVDTAAAMRAAAAEDLWEQWEFIDEPLVQAVHQGGGRLVAWTVNDPRAADRLAAIGVDAICTDVPDEIRASLGAGR